MFKLEPAQFQQAYAIFRPLTDIHLSLLATLEGNAPGAVWLDDLEHPRIGYAISPEGHYLVGDPDHAAAFESLKATIEHDAYLTCHPSAWEKVLAQIWDNRVARRHERFNLRFQSHQLPQWRTLLPDGFEFVQVDQPFLQRTTLENHEGVTRWIKGWFSTEDFLANGLGFCILQGDTIACMCMMDCRSGNTCEIGIRTYPAYRRRGLAAIAVAGMVDVCLAQGITTIGWHCLRNNVGSWRTAQKVGFVIYAEHVAFSSFFPAQNLGDLSLTEAVDWAQHYEWAATLNPNYRLDSAAAWALAGEDARVFSQLRQAVADGVQISPDWLTNLWAFTNQRNLPEFQEFIRGLGQN